MIPKEDALFKARKAKVNVQLHWVILFSMVTGLLLIKMDIAHYTGKPGNLTV